MKNIGVALFLLLMSSASFAGRYWVPVDSSGVSFYTSNWDLYINNNVVYVISPDLPSHCSHKRAQINITLDKPLDKALYAYLLAAYSSGKSLKIVVDSTQTTCVLDAAKSS